MKGSIYNAPVEITYSIERRNGWTRILEDIPARINVQKALQALCPPFVKTLVMKDNKARFYKDDDQPTPEFPSEILMGNIERVEIKIFYKER